MPARGGYNGALLSAVILSVTATAADLPLPAADQDSGLMQEGASLAAVCGKCHSLQIVLDTPMSYDGWHDTVQKMLDRGAAATDEQLADIMDYLHRTMTTINVNTADLDELGTVLDVPDSVAQAIIARRRARPFSDLADLESVPGIDASGLQARTRLVFFR